MALWASSITTHLTWVAGQVLRDRSFTITCGVKKNTRLDLQSSLRCRAAVVPAESEHKTNMNLKTTDQAQTV